MNEKFVYFYLFKMSEENPNQDKVFKEFKQFQKFKNQNISPFETTFEEFINQENMNITFLQLEYDMSKNEELKDKFLDLVRIDFELMVEDYEIFNQLYDSETNEFDVFPQISYILRIPELESFHEMTNGKYKREKNLVDLYEEADRLNSKPIPKINVKKLKIGAIFGALARVFRKMIKEKVNDELAKQGAGGAYAEGIASAINTVKKAKKGGMKELKKKLKKEAKLAMKKAKKELMEKAKQELMERAKEMTGLDIDKLSKLDISNLKNVNLDDIKGNLSEMKLNAGSLAEIGKNIDLSSIKGITDTYEKAQQSINEIEDKAQKIKDDVNGQIEEKRKLLDVIVVQDDSAAPINQQGEPSNEQNAAPPETFFQKYNPFKNLTTANLIDKIKGLVSKKPTEPADGVKSAEEVKEPEKEDSKAKDNKTLKTSHYKELLESIFTEMDPLKQMIFEDIILEFYDEKVKELDLKKLGLDPEDEASNQAVLPEDQKDKLAHFFLFINFFSAVITYFTNLKCKFYVDELENLNVEFYLETEQLYHMANRMHYCLNYKIISRNEISKEDFVVPKNLKQDEMTLYNSKPRETFYSKQIEDQSELSYFDNPMYHPPYDEFKNDEEYINFYRRYDCKDNLHLCSDCSELDSLTPPKCSDVFRYIDKSRVAIKEMEKLIDINKLNEQYVNEEFDYTHIMKKALISHNYRGFNFEEKEILQACLTIKTDDQMRNLLSKFRNLFGEELAFYFVWISHLINSLFYPASIGLAVFIVSQIIQYRIGETSYLNDGYDIVLKLPFTLFVLIWAKSYSDSWSKEEEFYKYEWGMNEYTVENGSIRNEKVGQFLNVEMPVTNKLMQTVKLTISWSITFIMLFLVILSNDVVFWLQGFVITTFPGLIERYSLSKYMYPASLFVIRQLNSVAFQQVSEILTDWEIHETTSEKRYSHVIKNIAFQFFNYYYNLYYIAFFKTDPTKCLGQNCKFELETQVTVLLISAILNDFVVIVYLQFFASKSIKAQIKTLNEASETSKIKKNASTKHKFYTRRLYEDQNADKEYIDVALSFGYVIQFGGSNPVCFFLCLISTVLARLADAVKLGVYEHVNFSSGSKGIGCHAIIINFLITMGIISNLVINFVTDARMGIYSKVAQYSTIMLFENILFVLLMFMELQKLPVWFNFIGQLKVSYLNFLKSIYKKSN